MVKIESLRTALHASAIYGPVSRAYEELRSIFLAAGAFFPPRPRGEVVGSAPELPPTVSLFVAASTGLFKIEQNEIRRVLKGEFCGITEYRGSWVVFEKCGKFGRLLSVSSGPASIGSHRGDEPISISLGSCLEGSIRSTRSAMRS